MPFQEQFSAVHVNYVPACLKKHPSEGWRIEYYVYNPVTQQLERKRIRLNNLKDHFRTIPEFKQHANQIVCSINARLAGGWSPFGESENARLYTPLVEVLEKYYQEKERELKEKSLSSYKSQVDIMKEWINRVVPGIKGVQFNQMVAAQYLDYIYLERKVSNKSYNNYLKHCRLFFSWAIEKCYTKENPFTHFSKKKEEKKKRVLIPSAERAIITEYFQKNYPEYLLVCHLVFTALIRPIEISRIKVKQVHLKEKYIYMPEEQTKNGYARSAPLSDELIQMLADRLKNAKANDYLIGERFLPGPVPMHVNNYAKTWAKMRERLNKGHKEPIIPDTMQLYSLRDTGINLMIKSGIDTVSVMHAADHHDLSITTKYADHVDPNLINLINSKAPKFFTTEKEDCSEAPELSEILGDDEG